MWRGRCCECTRGAGLRLASLSLQKMAQNLIGSGGWQNSLALRIVRGAITKVLAGPLVVFFVHNIADQVCGRGQGIYRCRIPTCFILRGLKAANGATTCQALNIFSSPCRCPASSSSSRCPCP